MLAPEPASKRCATSSISEANSAPASVKRAFRPVAIRSRLRLEAPTKAPNKNGLGETHGAFGKACRRPVVGDRRAVAMDDAGRGGISGKADHARHRFRAGWSKRRNGAHPDQEDGRN